MSALKYKDPETGEFKMARSVKVIGDGGGGESAPVVQPKTRTKTKGEPK